jgi:hypothetical protein
VLIALINKVENLESREMCEIQAFKMVLERMEQSEGFKSFLKRASRT